MKKKIEFLLIFLTFFVYSFFIKEATLASSISIDKYDEEKHAINLVVDLDFIPTDEQWAKLSKAFEVFNDDIYRYTLGLHHIGKLYFYGPDDVGQNTMKNKADMIIKLLNPGEKARSNATFSGWNIPGGRILIYADLSDQGDPALLGHVMAHEFGHYIYGVLDEYRETEKNNKGCFTCPHKNDDEKQTIMCCHWKYFRLSTPDDYKDSQHRNTAQWRGFHASAWEVLLTEPKLRYINKERAFVDKIGVWNYFPEFKKKVKHVPTLTELEKKQKNLQHDPEPILTTSKIKGYDLVIMIDRSGSMAGEKLKLAKNAAISYLKFILSNSKNVKYRVAIGTFEDFGHISLSLTDFNEQTIDSIFIPTILRLDCSGGTDLDSGLNVARNLLFLSSDPDSIKYVLFLSDGDGSLSYDILYDMARNGFIVYTIGFGSDVNISKLSAIANITGGKFYMSSLTNLRSVYMDIAGNSLNNQVIFSIDKELSENQRRIEKEFEVVSSEPLNIFSTFNQNDRVYFAIQSPDGTIIDRTNYQNFDGVLYGYKNGYAFFKLKNPSLGKWKAIFVLEEVDYLKNEQEEKQNEEDKKDEETEKIEEQTEINEGKSKDIDMEVDDKINQEVFADKDTTQTINKDSDIPDIAPTGPIMIKNTDFKGSRKVTLDVVTESNINVDVNQVGGIFPQPLIVQVRLYDEYPIKGANVYADIKTPSGKEVKNVKFMDDGKGYDDFADDGIYTLFLDSYDEFSSFGMYDLKIHINNDDNTASEVCTPNMSCTFPVDNKVNTNFHFEKDISVLRSVASYFVPFVDTNQEDKSNKLWFDKSFTKISRKQLRSIFSESSFFVLENDAIPFYSVIGDLFNSDKGYFQNFYKVSIELDLDIIKSYNEKAADKYALNFFDFSDKNEKIVVEFYDTKFNLLDKKEIDPSDDKTTSFIISFDSNKNKGENNFISSERCFLLRVYPKQPKKNKRIFYTLQLRPKQNWDEGESVILSTWNCNLPNDNSIEKGNKTIADYKSHVILFIVSLFLIIFEKHLKKFLHILLRKH